MALHPKRIPPLGPPRVTAQARVLALWRGVDLAPKQNELVNRTRNAGSLLPGLMSKLRIENRRSDAEVVKVWNELLDPNLVAHAQPSGLHKGTLFVTVDNSVWLSEIVRYRRKEILTRLQHSFGRELIQKISFRIG
jgi:hypothetical protein